MPPLPPDIMAMMTPTGRQGAMGAPLLPDITLTDTNPQPPGPVVPTTIPKLDSVMVETDLTVSIPWYHLMINLWRLGQPTGVPAGTYLGFTVNVYGQITAVQTTGIIINSPVVNTPTINTPTISNGTWTNPTTTGGTFNNPTINTQTANGGSLSNISITNVGISGTATAPTQAVADNSASIATTAFVKSQGYIPEAPIDGNRYARQNGVWVAF